jgi:hypothetical protein
MAVNGNEQIYSPDNLDPYQQPSPRGSTGFYTGSDSMQPMNTQDIRHDSVAISEVDGGSYFPSTSPASPYGRAQQYQVHYVS